MFSWSSLQVKLFQVKLSGVALAGAIAPICLGSCSVSIVP